MASSELLVRDAPPAAGQVPPAAAPASAGSSGAALWLIAIAALGAVVWAGQRFLIPLTAGLLLAFLLAPAVGPLRRVVRLEALAVLVLLSAVAGLLVVAVMQFGGHSMRVLDRLPDMIHAVAQGVKLTRAPGTPSTVGRVREALSELDKAATQAVANSPPPPARPDRRGDAAANAKSPAPGGLAPDPASVVRQTALTGSGLLMRVSGDLVFAGFVTFFVLSGGGALRNRFLDLWGADPAARQRASDALDEAMRQTRLYAAVLLATNVLIGGAVYLAFLFADLPDPAGWAIVAGLLHIVPYLGMSILTVLGAAETYLAHGSVMAAAGMAAFIVLLSTVVGTGMAAWLQARSSRMNPAAVFIGLMFWGAIWGVWGLLLGPALIVLMKVAAEHTPSGTRISRLLGG